MSTTTPRFVAEPAVLDRARAEPGSHGALRLVVERVAGRTRIVDLECTGPVQALRVQYLDPVAPDIASVTIASPSGGVFQGDRLSIEVDVRPGARMRLDTQSATRLYRMPERAAWIQMRFAVARDGWLEFVPDPWIPFAGSNTTIETAITVEASATVLLGEVVAAGRVARGEVFAMTAFRSTVTAVRPSGRLLFSDATILEAGEPLGDPGMIGDGTAIGSLYVVSAGADPDVLRRAIPAGAPAIACAGASTLPNEAGAWLRVIAADTARARAVVAAGHDAARMAALGIPPPPLRRP
jgi:urease accessory protein